MTQKYETKKVKLGLSSDCRDTVAAINRATTESSSTTIFAALMVPFSSELHSLLQGDPESACHSGHPVILCDRKAGYYQLTRKPDCANPEPLRK